MGQSWKEPVWEEGDVTGGSLGWQQETFSYIVIESGEARGTNTGLREFLPTLCVETASQLCSLILQLNSIQGEIRVKLGVCRCARTFGGWTEGRRQWAIGAAPLPSTFHPCAAWASPHCCLTFPGPRSDAQRTFFPPQTQVLIETEISTESWPLGCPIPLWHCSAKGYALQSLLNLLALGLPRILRSLVVLPCGKVYFVLHGSSVQYCFYFRNWELRLKEKWLF